MKIGLCQMDISWENKEANTLKASKFIKEAKDKNIDLLIFPEMTLTGFSMNASELSEKSQMDSYSLSFFSNKAEEFNINLGFGWTEDRNGTYFNNFSIISRQGILLSNYSKIHPFSFGIESRYYTGGNKFVSKDIEGIVFGSTICYDLRFPELYQILSKNCHLIGVIANWPEARRDHWITLLKARAIENQCYVVGVNRVGTGNNLYYSGDSMLVSPYGEVICSLKDEEGLIYGDISKDEVIQLQESFPVKKDRKEALYITGFQQTL